MFNWHILCALRTKTPLLRTSIFVFLLSNCLGSNDTRANFHFWDITEVYSNADGSVQFIELFTTFNGQQVLANHELRSVANTFNIPTNSPFPTGNRFLLFATPGFDSLPGGVTPDYTIPAGFFDPTADSINFAGVDSATFSPAPTDGILSLNYAFGSNSATTDTNSPTNFAGDVGSLAPAAGLDGDYNGNGVVDAADYAEWLARLGGNTLQNEVASSGVVDIEDFEAWKARLGNSSGTGTAANVPEPATLLLFMVFSIGLSFLESYSRLR